ncbi:MAG: DNA repair protein RecO (recombination protein O) [Alphaproteobacteria bacterium]|jgi:DNA repair protein RecO (recombination protein O)
MYISGEGIILKVKSQGRGTFFVSLFSEEYGKFSGLVRGSHKMLGDLQIGNIVEFEHTRRLETQLGAMSIEVLYVPSAFAFTCELRMKALQYLCEILSVSLREEEGHPKLYTASKLFLKELHNDDLWSRLGFYELQFLSSIGYGLSLSARDAVRNEGDDSPLLYVSPKSGRAVSKEAGEPYKDKILPLPALFGGESQDLLDVFRLTGHFLNVALEGRYLQARTELIQNVKQG